MSQGARIWATLVTVCAVGGSTYLGIAVAGETIPPLLAASTRFIVAGVLMAFVVRARGGSLRVTPRALPSCLIVGCLLPGANAVLFLAERKVSTGLASLLVASVPLWIVVFRLGARERMRWETLVGVGLGFAGVATLAEPSGGATLSGVGLGVIAAVMWAAGSFVSTRAPMPRDPFATTSYEMIAGGLVMFVPALLTVHHFSPSAGSIAGWLYLVTFGSVIGYTAYVWLLANAPLELVSTYSYVSPVVAVALGVLFRGEHLSWRLLFGATVVLAAVAMVGRRRPVAGRLSDEGVAVSDCAQRGLAHRRVGDKSEASDRPSSAR